MRQGLCYTHNWRTWPDAGGMDAQLLMVKSQVDNRQNLMSKKKVSKAYQNYSHCIHNWPVKREISKGWFPLTRFWLRPLTINFNHVNEIAKRLLRRLICMGFYVNGFLSI